jgi:uncharacterized protein YneF (UPF0154 family)
MTILVALVIILMCILIGWRVGLIAKKLTMRRKSKQCEKDT